MTLPFTRRDWLLAAATAPLAAACATPPRHEALARLAALEAASGGRLGVATRGWSAGGELGYRADERFPLCSTFKVLAAAAILARSARDEGLLARHIDYARSDLVAYSPVTQQHAGRGMPVADLCAAALQYSDNTVANLLVGCLGGPAAVTAFARSIGDSTFRLDRWETELNSALPGDPRDTSTPAAMAKSLQRLALGDALAPAQRDLLLRWMRGNTTGDTRIRAGVPGDWQVADKTGSGDHGTTNDIAVLWPPGRPPFVLALYFTQPAPDAKPRNDVLAEAARCVSRASN
jgi:beta-lactamase class A